MSAEHNGDAWRFLEGFFSGSGQPSLQELEAGRGKSAALRPFVLRLLGSVPLPSVLPHKGADARGNTKVIWYGIARSERELGGLGEELMAFVGPTWSTFDGTRAELDAGDPVDSIVLEYTGGAAFKFTGADAKILEALTLLSRVWEQRASRSPDVPVPTGRVLRDFYMALRVGNRESAERSLHYLADHHRMDAINLLFLKVQLLAEIGRWDELLGISDLPAVMKMRRPTAVTHALVRAVYRQELIEYEERGDPRGAVEHFHQKVFPEYGALFVTRAGSRDADVVKSFMMLAVGGKSPNAELRDELLRVPGFDEKDDLYLQQLASLLQTPTPLPVEDPLQRATQLVWSGAYDLAFELARTEPASKEQAQVLLECAYELNTIEAERAAVSAFDSLPAEDQTLLYASRRISAILDHLTKVREEAPTGAIEVEPPPADWEEWLTRLYSDPSWGRALTVAQQGAEEWDVGTLSADVGAAARLADMLGAYPTEAGAVLSDAIPFLLKFFQKDAGWPRRDFLKIYGALVYLLVMSTHGGGDDLEAFNDLTRALLSLGVGAEQYEELLGLADGDLWQPFAAPSTLDWALDLIDTLIIYPCPSPEKRSALLASVVNRLATFPERGVDAGQWKFIRLLVSDLHQERTLLPVIDEFEPRAEVTEAETKNLFERLKDKSVAIYTLTEAVAKRVGKILEERCRTVNVHISNDKVGNTRLEQLARGADIFIMATASAKHAATNFIEDKRTPGLPLLRPAGKGSASMLRVLEQHLETLPAA